MYYSKIYIPFLVTYIFMTALADSVRSAFLATSQNGVPFHNVKHADQVTQALIAMWYDNRVEFLLAGPSHDIDHRFAVLSDDEERAERIMRRLAQKTWLSSWIIDKTGTLIFWTIFRDRPHLSWDQPIIADADISNVWWDFEEHMRQTARLIIEQHLPTWKAMTRENILGGFRRNDGFYKFLTGITGNPDNPFLTREAAQIFPHFARNRDLWAQKIDINPDFFIRLVCEEWKAFFHVPLVLDSI